MATEIPTEALAAAGLAMVPFSLNDEEQDHFEWHECEDHILNLRTREVPREVYQVEGCDCTGGGRMHLGDCAIWRLTAAEVNERVKAAEARVREHTDELNRRLRAALKAVGRD